MKGISAYSKPDIDGGITVDVEGMLVDAITVMKASGYTKHDCIKMFSTIFDDVKVRIDTSAVKKDS